MKKYLFLSLGLSVSTWVDATLLQQHQRLTAADAFEIPAVTYEPEVEIAPIVSAPPLEPIPAPRRFIPGQVIPSTTPIEPVVVAEPVTTPVTEPEVEVVQVIVQPEPVPVPAPEPETAVEPPTEFVAAPPPMDYQPAAYQQVEPLQVNLTALKQGLSEVMRFTTTPTTGAATFTLMEVVSKALLWHPSVRQAQSQVLASKEQIDAAQAGYYPQISTGINGGYSDSGGSGNESMSVSAKQMIYDFGKVASTVKSARHGLSQEQARLLLSIDQLIEKTAFSALELMRAQEKQQIAREQLEALDDIWALAKDRAELGASAQSDVVQTLSRKEGAAALIWELQAHADVWLKELQSLTGERGAIYMSTDVPSSFGEQCSSHVLQLQSVPMMQIVEEQRGAAMAQFDLSSAEMYPTLSLDAGYEQYLRSRDNWVDGRIQSRRSDFRMMLNMNMNVFEGGGKVARKNAARYALQAVDAEKENVVLEVTRGFEESQNKQLLLSERLHVLEARIASIQITQDLYKQQYMSLGTRSLLDLLNTEQEIYQSKSDYVDNKYEMFKAQMACLYYGAQLRDAFEVATIQRGS